MSSVHYTDVEQEVIDQLNIWYPEVEEISTGLMDTDEGEYGNLGSIDEKAYTLPKPTAEQLWETYTLGDSTTISDLITKNQRSTVADDIRQKRDEMYAHFRDNVGAIDVGMAADALRARLIDPMTVNDWVQSQAIDGLVIPYDAIEQGYPEHAGQFEDQKERCLEDAQNDLYAHARKNW